MLFPKWPWLAGPALLGAITATFLTWQIASYIHERDTTDLIKQQEAALDKQETDLTQSCAAQKQVTYGVSNDFQNDLSAIDGLLSVSLRDNTAPACILPVAGEVGGRDEKTAGRTVVPQARGISTRWLKGLAAEADKLGAQLDACQSFIDQSWALNGQ